MKMIIYDGHVHTPYCPHGSKDPLEGYIENAMQLGLKGLTFTEHAPLPKEFKDPVPEQDSAMHEDDLYTYIEEVNMLKEKYKGKFTISLGLEVDFIEGFEKDTKDLLEKIGPYLDDSILSVHFLKHKDQYYCIDYSDQEFDRMIQTIGSIDNIYKLYFNTVKKSIESNLGPYKPKRIGHITLAHKFQKRFPSNREFHPEILDILEAVKRFDLQLDYNGAGMKKPLCVETYPPENIVMKAHAMGIPLVYGSDAHSISGLLQGSEAISTQIQLHTPISLT